MGISTSGISDSPSTATGFNKRSSLSSNSVKALHLGGPPPLFPISSFRRRVSSNVYVHKSENRAGHVLGPLRPIHRRGYVLFKKSLTCRL
jgi:hypothetical protein